MVVSQRISRLAIRVAGFVRGTQAAVSYTIQLMNSSRKARHRLYKSTFVRGLFFEVTFVK